MKQYDIVVGLEIHAELDTNSKVFCSCKNEFGAEPNTLVCPVCLGLPGALPVLNKKAVEYTIRAGLAFGCDINDLAIFERKNYFYPDLSKAYQISQLERPICLHGGIALDSGKFVRLNRIHLEEDAGKLIHKSVAVGTYIDYNRGGVPLIEIVTEPDLSSADEVVEFLGKLRSTLLYSGVAKCKMEQGGLRFDVNLSVKEKGAEKLGTRVEMKNLNSFKSVARAIDFESKRQIEILNNGGKVLQQTRGWDDNKGKNYTLRDKENDSDYRYFPDPDLLTVKITRDDVEKIAKTLPETIAERKARYAGLGLSDYDVSILLSEKSISDYYDSVLAITGEPKESANWVMTDVLRVYNGAESQTGDIASVISAENLAKIISIVLSGKISRVNSKVLFDECVATHEDAEKLTHKLGLVGEVSMELVQGVIDKIISEKPQIFDDYAKEPDDIINYFVGNIMRESKGKAKVDVIKPMIVDRLNRGK